MISVVVPIYNVEAYLRACLDSISAQTYTDWECVMMDDASTDSSAAIAAEYCAANPRFRLLHMPQNSGPAATRNAALKHISGQWVTFVDADDIVAPEFLATLLNLAHSHNTKIAACGLSPMGAKSPRAPREDVINSRSAIQRALYQTSPVLTTSMCDKLFASSLFDGANFRDGIQYEDLELMPRLWQLTELTAWTDKPLYFYRQRPGSIIHTFTPARLAVLDVTRKMEERFADDRALLRAARDRRLSANFNMFLLLEADAPEAAGCWCQIKRLRLGSLLNPHVRLKNKLGILLSYYLGRKLFHKLFHK